LEEAGSIAGQGVLNIACGKNLPYPESTGYTRIRASVNLACPVMLRAGWKNYHSRY
jgi:hypothetical protein